MNKKIISALIFIGFLGLASTALAAVIIPNPLCPGGGTADSKTCTVSFAGLLVKIAEGVGVIVTTLATIMIIFSAILFLTSAGSPEKMGTAKKAITYAIIGLVIGILASTIVAIVKNIIGV